MFDIFYIGTAPGLFAHERPADSLEHAEQQSRTRYCWVINYLSDYQNFDFLWEPPPWQSHQTHVWPSQHQSNGQTYLIPKKKTPDINREHAIVSRKKSVPRLHIKHSKNSPDQGQVNTRYISDYLGTLKRALSKLDWEYCWVTSDVCDYEDFDFTWHPSEWQDRMLHVFASDEQKFGDTFYVHVSSFLQKTQDLVLLEWFDTLHFVENIVVRRRPIPVVLHQSDSQVQMVWQHEFDQPVVQFSRYQIVERPPTMNLWREKTKSVISLTPGASTILVPREVKNHLHEQIYDYPSIDKSHVCIQDPPLDIVFISNGESNADTHWQRLCVLTKNTPNRVMRVHGIKGRLRAYRAAAELAGTDWFFAVFAKLEVSENFDWAWQPDRLQQAKHYIFHAINPVNGLVYGHMAMIAQNRRLIFEHQGQGLDFSLAQAHEVIPVTSGIARYNDDPWMAWRTAFRECIKLCANTDVESQYRLQRWLTKYQDTIDDYSQIGAQDAVEFYQSVNGDPEQLQKSYEWDWLADYVVQRRGQIIGL